MTKKQKLSIYLLKEVFSPDTALKNNTELLEYSKISKARYCYKTMPSGKPDWATYLDLDNIKTSSASALLFIPVSSRYFVISFGHGHTLLNDHKLINDFGLRTALNMLNKNKIKSTDIVAPSDLPKQRRTQTTQESSLRGHDIDGYIHILKNITGTAKDEYQTLSKKISATLESIKITTDKKVEDLVDLCKELLTIYEKEDCKTDFPEVFYIQSIKDEDTSKKLNTCLVEALNKQSEVYLEIPELIDFQEINTYRINFKDHNRNKPEFNDIPTIEEFYDIMPNDSRIKKIMPNNDARIKLIIESLKKWDLDLYDANNHKKQSFSLLKCLVFDTDLEKKPYHFSHGSWYCIDSQFKTKLEDKLNNAKKEKINDKEIPIFDQRNEADYNQHLADTLNAFLLDKQCILMDGYDRVEPCDVLLDSKKSNTFIHVKIKHGGSSGLSHLFEQGNVSVTLLQNKDQKFINGIKDKIDDFDPNKQTVVHFLILSKKNKHIPLFASIALFKMIDQIQARRTKVYWSIIAHENDNLQNH